MSTGCSPSRIEAIVTKRIDKQTRRSSELHLPVLNRPSACLFDGPWHNRIVGFSLQPREGVMWQCVFAISMNEARLSLNSWDATARMDRAKIHRTACRHDRRPLGLRIVGQSHYVGTGHDEPCNTRERSKQRRNPAIERKRNSHRDRAILTWSAIGM